VPVTVSAPPPASKKATASTANTMTRKARERAEGLAGIGQLLTAGLLFARQPADAIAVSKFWPPIAEEAARLADDNPKAGEFLDQLTAVGPYAGIIGAVMPLAMQILVNHDRIKVESVSQLGVVSKATMQAEAELAIMKAEMAAMQEQMETQAERQKMMAEYEKFASDAHAESSQPA
jgi:hypothetical protein